VDEELADSTTSSNSSAEIKNSTVPENKENIVDEEGIIFEEEFEFATQVWEM